MNEMEQIRSRLMRVREEADAAARRAGGTPPVLVAVTKSATDEQVLALARLGVSDMAENRVQMFLARQELLAAAGFTPAMHLIGSLQKNKVKYLPHKTALIQSLDSLSLAEELQRIGERDGFVFDCLLEINSGKEENKGGVLPDDARRMCEALTAFPRIRLCGLMTMGPVCPDPEDIRPYFRDTRRLFLRLRDEGYFPVETPVLSMGMSGSFRIAVEEGSTMIRIGRTLFSDC